MRILLDTHVFLWAVTNDPKLSQTAQQLILDAEEVFISAASIWEISVSPAMFSGRMAHGTARMARITTINPAVRRLQTLDA